MKKFIIIALAALMAISAAVPAFAVDATGLEFALSPAAYKQVNGVLEVEAAGWTIKPGQTVYIELTPIGGDTVTTKLANSYKVYADWSVGKAFVESAKIEYKRANVDIITEYALKANANLSAHNTALFNTPSKYLVASYPTLQDLEDAVNAAEKGGDAEKQAALADFEPVMGKQLTYIWAVSVTTKSSLSVKSEDLVGTIRVGKNKTDANGNNPYSFDSTVKYGVMIGYDGYVDPKNAPVVDFSAASDEIELNFGSTASFTFNASTQSGKLFLGWDEMPQADIYNSNMEANIEFLRFEAAPTFNRIGELRVYNEHARYLYEVKADGSIKKLNALYNEDEGCLVLKTRTLGAYAFSDIELEAAPTQSAPAESSQTEQPSVSAPVTPPAVIKPVPPTGSAA